MLSIQRFGVLHRDHVVVAGFRIDPVTGRNHAVGGERGDHIVDHLLGREPDQAGALAVDVQLAGRGSQCFAGCRRCATLGMPLNLGGQLLRQSIGSVHVVRFDLNIDRRRQTLVDDAVDQAAGLEVGGELGHLRAKAWPARGACIHSCRCCDLLSGWSAQRPYPSRRWWYRSPRDRDRRRCWRRSCPGLSASPRCE